MPADAPPPPQVRPADGPPRAVVLVLPGGRADSREHTRPWHLSAVRMLPFARALHRELRPQGVAVWGVRYRVRGWNGTEASPVADARHVLEQVRARHGEVPVVLLGHSMGARTALRVCDDPLVRGVTGLAPWLPDGEPVRVDDVVVHLVHGDTDRWTDLDATARWAERARPLAAGLSFTVVHGGGHFMLRRPRTWHDLARAGVVAGLAHALGDDIARTGRPAPTHPGRRT